MTTRVGIVLCFALALLALPVCAADRPIGEADLVKLLETGEVKGDPERLWGGNDVKFILRIDDGSKRGLKVVFRPEHLVDEWKHRKEIAAFRLSVLCGIDNVPVTVIRSFPERLFRHAGEKALARLAFHEGMLEGAVQLFVKGARDPLGTDGFAWAKERLSHLTEPGGAITMELHEARQFARLIVFDYLQSNPDRFTGGNLLVGKDGRYWFIDNADTYYKNSRISRRFKSLAHFDRTLVVALRSLTEDQLQAQLSKLLGRKQVGRMWKRLQKVIKRIDSLVDQYGEERVLF